MKGRQTCWSLKKRTVMGCGPQAPPEQSPQQVAKLSDKLSTIQKNAEILHGCKDPSSGMPPFTL